MLDLSTITTPDIVELREALLPVSRQTERLRIDWLLIGAAGRDVMFTHVLDWTPSRGTQDYDIAIQVSGWPEYRALREALISQEEAVEDPDAKQRVRIRGRHLVDIVPFGDRGFRISCG